VIYALLADLVLLVHLLFVVAVIAGLPLIIIGGARGWRWVRSPVLRVLHLGGILIVAAQAWAGVVCPLTHLEMWLRHQGGLATYDESFIEYWLQNLLYWNLPAWVFVLAYTTFALLVIATWVLFPPVRRRAADRE
jgi:hypothetical protein